MPQQNPPISSFLRWFTWVETLVLLGAGGGLFFFPTPLREQWMWTLTPFNTRFLAAIYLGALMSIALMAYIGRWSPTRPVLRMIFVFTLIVLLVSLAYFERFEGEQWSTWAWFALYIALPLSAGVHLWLYRAMPTTQLKPVPPLWGRGLWLLAGLSAFYGLGLLLLPETFSSVFPWTLDEFHSRLYSATFFSGAVGLFSVATRATAWEFIAAGLPQVGMGFWAILGLVIVDMDVQVIDWSAPKTLFWVAVFAVTGLYGLGMIWFSKELK